MEIMSDKKTSDDHIGDSNEMVSSIKWLYKQLYDKTQVWNSTKNYQEVHIVLRAGEFSKLFEQAEAMRKAEIVNAVDGFPVHTRHLLGDDYYNEVYGCSDAQNESRNFGNESEDIFQGD